MSKKVKEAAVPVSWLRDLADGDREAALHWRNLGRHEYAQMFHRAADEVELLCRKAEEQ